MFLLSGLVTGHANIMTGFGVMTIFVYKIDQKSGNRKYIRRISGDWGELGIPNLARMSLIKCY